GKTHRLVAGGDPGCGSGGIFSHVVSPCEAPDLAISSRYTRAAHGWLMRALSSPLPALRGEVGAQRRVRGRAHRHRDVALSDSKDRTSPNPVRGGSPSPETSASLRFRPLPAGGER